MKIVTWNVNGIRSFDGKWKSVMESFDADIICVQETKVTRDMLDEPTAFIDGYTSYFAFSRKKTGYSGVATFCKTDFTPIQAEEGLGSTLPSSSNSDNIGYNENILQEFSLEELKSLDSEGRCVITQHQIHTEGDEDNVKKLAVINVYCPQDRGGERLEYQLKFYKLLEMRAVNLIKAGVSVIILGDINCSHKEIDHCEPYPDFHLKPSRQWMDQLLHNKPSEEDLDWKINSFPEKYGQDSSETYFFDAFRQFHPERKEAFTCWNSEKNCRSTNFGTRLDYILTSNDLRGHLVTCDIHPDIQGSDHCPVSAQLAFLGKNSVKLPALCTKYFPEFSGSQQKLSTYFNKTKPEKRKLESDPFPVPATGKKKVVVAQQKNISSFFIKKTSQIIKKDETIQIQETIMKDIKTDICENRQKAANAWKNVMKGPPTAPVCKGHSETCVLRTVKKKGPNLNRQFWCCAKGEGRSDDPNARCDFFKWLK